MHECVHSRTTIFLLSQRPHGLNGPMRRLTILGGQGTGGLRRKLLRHWRRCNVGTRGSVAYHGLACASDHHYQVSGILLLVSCYCQAIECTWPSFMQATRYYVNIHACMRSECIHAAVGDATRQTCVQAHSARNHNCCRDRIHARTHACMRL